MEGYPGFETKFAGLPDTVDVQKLQAVVKMVDSVEQHVATVMQAAKMSTLEKNMLQAQLHFHYARRLHELRYEFRNTWGNPLWEAFEDSLVVRNRLPSVEEVGWSPEAAGYLAAYADWQFGLVKRMYVKDRKAAERIILEDIGAPIDSLRSMEQLYGDAYIAAIYLRKHMPAPQHERLLANAVIFHSNAREAIEAAGYSQLLTNYYPNGKTRSEVLPYLQRLKEETKQGIANKAIRVADNGKSVENLAQLLAPYRGKLVYRDIWGTWCGACMQEMQYSHALKKQMAGEDVVFLYVSNDDDKLDGKWRNYIYTNNITGVHLRMDKNIERIWQVLVPGNTRRYPGHFLFDREGNRIPQEPVSPAQTVELRKQLRSLL
ncbi:TlpA family protein disulfide reductase [Chitinophaga sedimenti]|uniref:TlpA family protein disulfide reductase n=1 Tax=Chitinophaga sedimenti TaxID=2033606 RepID=UPI00200467C8|nr:TlpA disulfide reductase family protein [Chitinophaga sedimenti]MCK7556426.1 TlpA family protein disulfide reductase [Chitinophaga sedimenti]